MAITRVQALAGLESPDRLTRREAARTLAEKGETKDRGAVVRALNREHDPWVRRELGVAIRQLGQKRARADIPEITIDARVDELRAEVIQELSELLLHEVRPLVGAAKLSAAAEFNTYDQSETRKALDRLSDLLEALALLNRAATAPVNVDEFDLGEVVAFHLRTELGEECKVERLLAGPQPAPVTSTRALVEIVLANGLRNAIESVRERGDISPCDGVVVNWGITNSDYWISVIDDGIGLPEASDQLF